MTLRKCTKEELNYIKECRQTVKGANFALLYGAGVKTLSQSLMSADPNLEEKEARKLAKLLIEQKKGKKDENGYYYGGSDSAIYNALLKVANSNYSQLPVLGTKISAALRRNVVGNDYITARTNFAIQATGTEMLSTILVTVMGLVKKYKLDAHYVISIHDELHFMVNKDQVEEFCALFQLAHFYSWNLFHEKFGIKEFPWGRAFFSDVNVRHCICKEANEEFRTISNEIDEPFGESLTIKDLKNKDAFKKLWKMRT